MKEKIIRKVFNGIVYIHILHHGSIEPFYGTWMMEELQAHGYKVSPGTIYPILKEMVSEGLLNKEEVNIDGKIRKYYSTTTEGVELLNELKENLNELFHNVL